MAITLTTTLFCISFCCCYCSNIFSARAWNFPHRMTTTTIKTKLHIEMNVPFYVFRCCCCCYYYYVSKQPSIKITFTLMNSSFRASLSIATTYFLFLSFLLLLGLSEQHARKWFLKTIALLISKFGWLSTIERISILCVLYRIVLCKPRVKMKMCVFRKRLWTRNSIFQEFWWNWFIRK